MSRMAENIAVVYRDTNSLLPYVMNYGMKLTRKSAMASA